MLTLTSAQTEHRGNARDINFDPLILPDGIEPSDDPLLSARSAVYAASYRRRAGETAANPPAVEVDRCRHDRTRTASIQPANQNPALADGRIGIQRVVRRVRHGQFGH
ncbi:catalase family protein [Mycobacterium xenopi 4042]|uniref:Catalase family protein n=1 Tax=Mycobacterium xenopi 4042 TaxID=1299334 RepID=X8DC88_MYCXE|nr:catalase family protein [Mycobacterium xenopi 4042]